MDHNSIDAIHVVKVISSQDPRAKEEDFIQAKKKEADRLRKRKI